MTWVGVVSGFDVSAVKKDKREQEKFDYESVSRRVFRRTEALEGGGNCPRGYQVVETDAGTLLGFQPCPAPKAGIRHEAPSPQH